MPMQVFVTFQNTSELKKINVNDREVLDTLGPQEEAISVQLKELLNAVKESVRESIDGEGELSVEINGAIDVRASGELKCLFFNVGTNVNIANTMKVVLKTKITSNNA